MTRIIDRKKSNRLPMPMVHNRVMDVRGWTKKIGETVGELNDWDRLSDDARRAIDERLVDINSILEDYRREAMA